MVYEIWELIGHTQLQRYFVGSVELEAAKNLAEQSRRHAQSVLAIFNDKEVIVSMKVKSEWFDV